MPFRIGLQDFHLEATVTAVGINTGGGVGAEVPLDVFTLYALSWAGGSTDSDTLNGTVRAAEGKDVMTPRLCASVPVGLFSAEVTNDYDQTSGNNGDCAPALGQECVDTITNADFSTDDTEGCAPFTVPEACMESMPANGTIAMGSVLTNTSQTSPAGFFYRDEVVPAGMEKRSRLRFVRRHRPRDAALAYGGFRRSGDVPSGSFEE